MVGDEPDVAALAAVTAVRPAESLGAFATECHAACSPIAAAQLSWASSTNCDTGHATHRVSHPFLTCGHDRRVMQDRAERWASTIDGAAAGGVRVAHADSWARVDLPRRDRLARQEREHEALATTATRAVGAGDRAGPKSPTSGAPASSATATASSPPAFRRLAGKTQVFVPPDDHQRTGSPALEVAQVSTSVARVLGLNVALTEAIALGHDCGHGPGGRASEDALTPYVDGGFDHAEWGADVTLAPLNLCTQTLDGIRNHSWSRPAPATPEGEVVSWADRIAYVCHDFEDAVAAGIVAGDMLPAVVADRCGPTRSKQLGTFIRAMVEAAAETGRVGMTEPAAEALAEFRRFNYDHVYLRPASRAQAAAVIELLRRSSSTTATDRTCCRTRRGRRAGARRPCGRPSPTSPG